MKVSRQLHAVTAVILGKDVRQPLRWWLGAPQCGAQTLGGKKYHVPTRFRTAIRRSFNRYIYNVTVSDLSWMLSTVPSTAPFTLNSK